MKPVGVQLPEAVLDKIDRLAEEHNTTRSAILRNLLDNGLRAQKYYPDDFHLVPEVHEEEDAVELTREAE